ncbi:MAG: hypothetical protein IID37_07860 [Planctomycetes bacterium]|nr:hypothetical protein [Planctomycetota bacterium]
MGLRTISTDSSRATIILIVLAVATAGGLWYDSPFGTTAGALIADVRNVQVNTHAAGVATQNYYGELLQDEEGELSPITLLDAAPLRLRDGRKKQGIQESGAIRYVDNCLLWELLPGARVIFKGAPLEINQWGQRDRSDYTKKKPRRTFRIALVGGSNTMGTGVLEEETFGNLIEERLNGELAGQRYDRYEVINFSVAGYHLLERVYLVQTKVGDFEPDLILVSSTDRDLTIQHTRLARRVYKDGPIHFQFLRKIVRESGCDARRDALKRLERKIQPFQEEILLGTLRELTRYARQTDTTVAVFLLRREGGKNLGKDLVRTRELLETGDLPIFPVFEAYADVGPMELWLHPAADPNKADPHPNVEAHRRIAEDLYEQLLAHPTIGRMIRGR